MTEGQGMGKSKNGKKRGNGKREGIPCEKINQTTALRNCASILLSIGLLTYRTDRNKKYDRAFHCVTTLQRSTTSDWLTVHLLAG